MGIREYVLSIAASAIVCVCIKRTSNNLKIIKILCGIFVSLMVFRPVLQINYQQIIPDLQIFSEKADIIIEDVEIITQQQKAALIKEKCEAYICNKGSELGCQISATVKLDESCPYPPVEVSIEGNVSPYAKIILTRVVASDLGIPAEDQQWK